MFRSVKDYLSSYLAMQREITDLEQRLAKLEEQSVSLHSPLYSALPKSAGTHDISDILQEIDELEQTYRLSLLKARVQCARIEHLILSLSSPRQKQVLRARYIDGLSWGEVSQSFMISESILYSIHKKAISELSLRYGCLLSDSASEEDAGQNASDGGSGQKPDKD